MTQPAVPLTAGGTTRMIAPTAVKGKTMTARPCLLQRRVRPALASKRGDHDDEGDDALPLRDRDDPSVPRRRRRIGRRTAPAPPARLRGAMRAPSVVRQSVRFLVSSDEPLGRELSDHAASAPSGDRSLLRSRAADFGGWMRSPTPTASLVGLTSPGSAAKPALGAQLAETAGRRRPSLSRGRRPA